MEIAKYGTATVRTACGDWTTTRLAKWKPKRAAGVARYCWLMDEESVELLALGATGASLRISASRRQLVAIGEDPWFDAAISVDAYPFAGTIDTIFTLSDFRDWAESMRSVVQLPHRAVLGGNRAAQVLIDIERQIGGPGESLALEVSVTPSGDDPFPYLRFLIFDVAPFWEQVAARVDKLD